MTSTQSAIWLKLFLAPSLVGLVSILVTRIGARLGGIVAAFPMVSGPVLLLFALEQGDKFAADAAINTLVGTLSLVLYCAAYARVAIAPQGLSRPWLCLLSGWLTFAISTFLLNALTLPRATAIPIALVSIPMGLWLLPKAPPPSQHNPKTAPSGTRYLHYRMAAAAALVFTLSEAAASLGPTYSGLLTPFPVASTVLLVATHLEQGVDTTIRWLRGFVAGLAGYLAFIATLSLLLVPLGTGWGFTVGLVVAAIVQIALLQRK